MAIKLLVRQGGGAASEVDYVNIGDGVGTPIFDGNTPLIEMGTRFEQGQASMGSIRYVNPTAILTNKFRPHAEVKLIEDDSGTDYIIAWHRFEGAGDVGRPAPYTAADRVEHDEQTMDCNMDLRGLPFENGVHRDAEDSWERLAWLFAAKYAGSASVNAIHRDTTDITCEKFISGHLVDASSPVDLDAKNYPKGTFPEEILADIMEEWGMYYGVTLHHEDGVGTHKCLLVLEKDDHTTFASDLKISDQLADWDPDHPTAPVFEPVWRRQKGKLSDKSSVISGLISIYGGTNDEPRTVDVDTGESPDDWETWYDVYQDDLAENETQATRRANFILNDRKRPYITHQPSILVGPEHVTLITAGQSIETKSVVLEQGPDKHAYVWRRITEVRWEPSYDGRWWAHLELERPRNTRPRAGGGQPKSTSPKPPPFCTPDPGDTVDKEFKANDAGGDTLTWTGLLPNQSAGAGTAALGTDYYYFKSTSPTTYSYTWAWSAGDVVRVAGYIGCRTESGAGLKIAFTNLAANTPGGSVPGSVLAEYTLATNPTKHSHANEWTLFGAGPFTAPVGTTSICLGKVGASVNFDETTVYLVGSPTDNDDFCVPEGSYDPDNPYVAPAGHNHDDDYSPLEHTHGPADLVISWKAPVRVATTANGTLASAFDAGSSVDGITLAEGDRILIKNQSTPGENGIYVVAASGAPTRSTTFDEDTDVPGAMVRVMEGTTNADTVWGVTDDDAVIGTDDQVWAQLSGGSGAPTGADYLVGTAQAGLSAEIVVGTTPGGELGGTWASPTVDATHSGSAHHTENHQSRHNEGGADELKLDDLAVPDDNTDLDSTTSEHGLLPKLDGDATLYLDGSGNWTDPGLSGGSTGNVIATPTGSAITIPGLALGDRKPSSPGTYDEEFDGTADTLPSGDWSFDTTPSGSDVWTLNSRWPSMLTVEGTANTTYNLTRVNFNAAATFGLWWKLHMGPWVAADDPQMRLVISNSTTNDRRAAEMRASGSHSATWRAVKRVGGGAEAVWSSALGAGFYMPHCYFGITRDSNNWLAWLSTDGIAWERLATTESHTFTVDRFYIVFKTSASGQCLLGLDWIRYRTDIAFPRP